MQSLENGQRVSISTVVLDKYNKQAYSVQEEYSGKYWTPEVTGSCLMSRLWYQHPARSCV